MLKYGVYFKIIMILFYYNLYAQKLDLVTVPGGEILNISIHPNSNIFYTSGFKGQIFMTEFGKNKPLPILNPTINRIINEILIDSDVNYNVYLNVTRIGQFYSDDKGKNWFKFNSDGSVYPRMFINPKNSSTIFIKRNSREIFKTFDKGKTWQKKLTTSREITDIAVSSLDTNFIYVTADRRFWRSTDGGETWELRMETAMEDGRDLYINPYNKNSVFFHSEMLFKTENGFKNIKQLSPPNIVITAYAVNPVDTNTIYIAPRNVYWPSDGVILKTTDGGSNWFAADNGIQQFYNKAGIYSMVISPRNPEEIYISVSHAEGAYRSTNGGESWERAAIYNNEVISMFIPKNNPEYLFVRSPADHYYYSTDNGVNWVVPDFEEAPASVSLVNSFSFNPINPDSGFLASGKDLLLTTDRGKTWKKTGILNGVNQITYHKYNPRVMFASVYPNDSLENGLYRSADGGLGWDYVTNSVGANLKFSKANPNIIYEFWYNGVSKSTDMGVTWFGIDENLPQDPDDRRFSALVVGKTDANLLYLGQKAIGDSLGSLRMSTDGGDTWIRIDSKLKEYEKNLDIGALLLDVNNDNRLFVGCLEHGQYDTESYSKGGLYLTENNGESWRKIYDGYVDYIYSDESEPSTIYFNTRFGLWKFVDTLTTSVKTDNDIVSTFKLAQNYPNPFNSSTIIEYSIDNPGYVKIEVYNSLGQKISELVNGYKVMGNYRAEFNASNLPSGIYFYRLNSGRQTLVKKMLLLK